MKYNNTNTSYESTWNVIEIIARLSFAHVWSKNNVPQSGYAIRKQRWWYCLSSIYEEGFSEAYTLLPTGTRAVAERLS
jgi:hypothetical protein